MLDKGGLAAAPTPSLYTVVPGPVLYLAAATGPALLTQQDLLLPDVALVEVGPRLMLMRQDKQAAAVLMVVSSSLN